jgi:plasmid maintenance system antidote protein VapI
LDIPQGNRQITADTALRLSLFFGNSAKFRLEMTTETVAKMVEY